MQHIDKLRIFHAVAELGSLTRAADYLGVSKSTVSRTVTALEELLAIKLLHRSARQLTLTDEGEKLLRHCESIAGEYQSALDELAGRNQRVSGRLTVCLPTLVGQLLVAPRMQGFMQRYPDLEVSVDLRHTSLLELDSRTELAVIFGELPDSSMIAKRLAEIGHTVCATPAYLEQFGKPAQPEELVVHNCLLLSLPNIRNANRWLFQHRHSHNKKNITLKQCFSTNDTFMAKQMMLGDAGICALPSYAVAQEIEQGRVVSLLDDYALPTTSIYAVYRSRMKNNTRISVFLEFLQTVLSS